jgi:hypothetical protein
MAWIFFNDAFLSIVTDPKEQGWLLVRGRVKGDIERVFPCAIVRMTPNNDYRFRANIPRDAVASAIADRIMNTNYPNFKGSVKENERHDAYLSCWHAMNTLQRKMAITRPKARAEALFEEDGLMPMAPWEDLADVPFADQRKPCQNKEKRQPRRR